jgi:AcrR family transcriptional regulator
MSGTFVQVYGDAGNIMYADVIAAMPRAESIREVSRRFVVHNTHEQIQLAAIHAVAASGYQAMGIRDICAEAHISPETFYRHFSDKQEVVLMAVEAGVDQLMGHCQEAFRVAPSWPDGIWDVLQIGAESARAEPAFAIAAITELLTVGPDARELLRSLMDAFALFLQPAHAVLESSATHALDVTIGERVFELLYTHLASNPPDTLTTLVPQLARTVLTPFIGPQVTETFVARRQAGYEDYSNPTRRGSA